MISTERPDPATAHTPGEYLDRMRRLRLWAGQPSLRSLHRLAGKTTSASGAEVDALPTSTTSYVLNGRGLPRLPRWEFVEAFVTACLKSGGHPLARIAPEVERWRAVWRAIAAEAPSDVLSWQADAEGQQEERRASGLGETFGKDVPAAGEASIPVPQSSGRLVESPPEALADDPPVEPPTEGSTGRSGRRSAFRFRLLGAAAVSAVALIAGAVAVIAMTRDGPPNETVEATTQPTPTNAPRELRRGNVPALRDTDGIDLDLGSMVDQRAPGIDVTPWGVGNHLVSKGGAQLALVKAPGPEGYERCASLPAKARGTQIRGLHDVAVGTEICVWTDQGHLALLTLDQQPSRAVGALSFRYVVWEQLDGPTGGASPMP